MKTKQIKKKEQLLINENNIASNLQLFWKKFQAAKAMLQLILAFLISRSHINEKA